MERSIGFEMRSIGNLVKRRIVDVHDEHAFDRTTGMHGFVIHYLVRHQDREVFQRDFEEKFLMRRSTVSRMLALMEKNGMIKRISSKKDARQKQIVLTEKALAKHAEIAHIMQEMERDMRKDISPEDMDTFFRVIDKIKQNLE